MARSNLTYEKKFFTSLLEMNFKKSNLIEIPKCSKKEHKHMHLTEQLTQLKTHLFYHLISKCSSDLLNIDFAESVAYHWKKVKTSYSSSLFQLKETKKSLKKLLCSLGTMHI